MRHEIKDIQHRSGTTTLFVTHDQDEALDMADEIAVLSNGTIAQYATPTTIYDHPANRFVANFVGRTNFLSVTVNRSLPPCQYVVSSPTFGQFTVTGSKDLGSEGSILVVRPHHFNLVTSEKASKESYSNLPSTSGRIIDQSYTGNVRTYTIKTTDSVRVTAENLTTSGTAFRTGDTVRVSFDPDDAHLVSAS